LEKWRILRVRIGDLLRVRCNRFWELRLWTKREVGMRRLIGGKHNRLQRERCLLELALLASLVVQEPVLHHSRRKCIIETILLSAPKLWHHTAQSQTMKPRVHLLPHPPKAIISRPNHPAMTLLNLISSSTVKTSDVVPLQMQPKPQLQASPNRKASSKSSEDRDTTGTITCIEFQYTRKPNDQMYSMFPIRFQKIYPAYRTKRHLPRPRRHRNARRRSHRQSNQHQLLLQRQY
jgi:hypothetical protein